MKDSDNCYRNFDQKEDGYDDNKHQSRAVGVPEFPAFRFPVFLEESLPVDLGGPHGSEEENVEDHQGCAGYQVNEEDSKTVVCYEVGIQRYRLHPGSHFDL